MKNIIICNNLIEFETTNKYLLNSYKVKTIFKDLDSTTLTFPKTIIITDNLIDYCGNCYSCFSYKNICNKSIYLPIISASYFTREEKLKRILDE